MVGIATVSDVIPDSVRVEFVENIDLSNKSDLDRIVHLVMQAVNDCGESAAMGGLFTD